MADLLSFENLGSLLTLEHLSALLTLTALEIVLGIDNIVFIAILSGRLPEHERPKARTIGLALAMVMRIALLLAIGWIMGLTKELFSVFDHSVTGKDLVLLGGGLFLLAKATYEIHHRLEASGDHPKPENPGSPAAGVPKSSGAFTGVIVQILLLDAVFSLDSVITAVGMARRVEIMIVAVILAVIVMMVFAGPISRFIERHPTMKMLALSFLVLIGFVLVTEGLGQHINKGYIYSAMAFSLLVELLNIRAGRGKRPAAQAAEA